MISTYPMKEGNKGWNKLLAIEPHWQYQEKKIPFNQTSSGIFAQLVPVSIFFLFAELISS
jgi:hypothetical protein